MERRFAAERELAALREHRDLAASSPACSCCSPTSITRPLVALSQLPTRAGMPLAMGLIFVSLFVIVSRKKALTQVIGFLMLENGHRAAGRARAPTASPSSSSSASSSTSLMGFLVMQIFVYQIHETFESMDVEQLNRLRRLTALRHALRGPAAAPPLLAALLAARGQALPAPSSAGRTPLLALLVAGRGGRRCGAACWPATC